MIPGNPGDSGTRRRRAALMILIGALTLTALPRLAAPQGNCPEPPQAGFRPLRADQGEWNWDPFAFVRSRSSGVSPLPRLTQQPRNKRQPRTIAVRLDDGRRGTLRVAPRCRHDEHCTGPDWEGYWLEVRGSGGDVVARQP